MVPEDFQQKMRKAYPEEPLTIPFTDGEQFPPKSNISGRKKRQRAQEREEAEMNKKIEAARARNAKRPKSE